MNRIYVKRKLTKNPVSLPLFFPWHLKWPAGLITVTLSVSFYVATNHYLTHASFMQMTWIDQNIPFIPESVWIYWSGVLIIPAAFFLNRCIVSMNLHLYSFFTLFVIAGIWFWLYPVTYPRDHYPLPQNLDLASRFLFQMLRAIDTPVNCFPSLHVASSFLVALGFLEDQQKYFKKMFGWASAISLSTLTTKQHYFLDILGGIGLALILFWFFHRLLPYRLLSQGIITAPRKSVTRAKH